MRYVFLLLCALASFACRAVPPKNGAAVKPTAATPDLPDAPWRRETSQAAGHEPKIESPTTLLRGARLLLGDGGEIAKGFVLIRDGKIAAVGEGDGTAPQGATIVDAAGKVITPGLIDTHSHLGVYPMPMAKAHLDGNEMTSPLTPGVRAVDAFWPQDPGIERALAGGVTTLQALPGSGNLIGGRAVTLKLRHATSSRAMHFAGAKDGLKIACGENPKRVYGGRTQMPMTRMGNLELQRDAFMRARRLIAEWDEWRAAERERIEKERRERAKYDREAKLRADRQKKCGEGPAVGNCAKWRGEWADNPLLPPIPSIAKLAPKRDLDLETLAAAIEGRVLVHIHCYRSDDMANMIALADEAGFSIRSFHHALEAYKIRKTLAARDISVSTWADWWGFKLEAYDGIQENLALVAQSGGRAIVHSDSEEGIRRLNQEASKGMWSGRQAGIDLRPAEVIKWVTLNPAWALGVHERTGSLTVGKDADVVVWDADPFSVYARAERVFVDGVERLNLKQPGKPWSDFEAAP